MPAHDDATVAAVFRATLTLGIATPADLVPWADGQVLVRERPAEWVLDLSTGSAVPADQVGVALLAVASGADPAIVFGLVLGLVDGAERWTEDQARRAAGWVELAARACAAEAAASDAGWIDEQFTLCDLGEWGDRRAVTADAVGFVRDHADPAARAWLPGVRVRFAADD